MQNFKTNVDSKLYPNLARCIETGTVWVEDNEFVTVDRKDGEIVQLGCTDYNSEYGYVERWLIAEDY